jgi:hypothetical protein
VLLQLNPLVVSRHAVASTFLWVKEEATDRAIVEAIGTDEPLQILPNPRDIFDYLSHVLDRRTSRPDFMSSPMHRENSQFAGRLAVAIDIVRSDIDLRVKSDMLQRMFDGRTVLSQLDEGSGQYRIQAVGDRLRRFLPDIEERFLGRCFGEALGGAYGRWITDTLATYTHTTDPTNEYVEAVVQFGNWRPRRIYYERMLVPAMLGSGSRQLLTVSSVA